MTVSRDSGKRRHRQVHIDWDPPGPVPPGDRGDPALQPTDDETLDCVCGHWRIFQRRDGHRFSTDDVLCAWYAAKQARERRLNPRHHLDLGTGIGSVALIVSWYLPDVSTVGVEVQDVSAGLARRSVRYNGIEDRFDVVHTDLRQFDPGDRRFDLVTGSPPYLPIGAGLESHRTQRGPARFGHKGDVIDYARAAVRCMAPGGLFVLVYAAYRPQDVPTAAAEAGLVVLDRLEVVPRAGKEPLLELVTLGRVGEWSVPEHLDVDPLTVRDEGGNWTPEYQEVRASMGFPRRRPQRRPR